MKIESSLREVITSQDLQNAYLKFYPFMMKFLWDINTVMHLANLEISIYKRFVDIEEVKRNLNLLELDIRDTYKDSDLPELIDFEKAFEYLKDCVESYEESGYEIYKISENLDTEAILAEDDSSKDSHKENSKEIHVGKVVKR